jgi:hypothetical protein
MRAHVINHLGIDPLCRPAQRELPQSREIAWREIMLNGALGHIRHIDLALVQPCDQILGRKVDRFNVVGAIDDRVRHGLADSDPRDLATMSLRLSTC